VNQIMVYTDGHVEKTGVYMRQMVDDFYTDMVPYASLSLIEIFDLIKNIPYRCDPEEAEVLMRPLYTMNMMGYGGDCDDKSIALASYCKLKNIPCKFVAVRSANRDTFHHVFCYIFIGSMWMAADPTYNFNSLGWQRKQYAEYAII